jgi:mannosyltransferase OCH1-like enzyme
MTIPKKLHFVWVGDESKRPDNLINTWKKYHPDWEVKVWGNREYHTTKWQNKNHMDEMWDRELSGVADMMRYEILYMEGGIALDADSICLQTLPDWLLEPSEFSCWENEIVRPGLIAAGYLGAVRGSPLLHRIIADIKSEDTVCNREAWRTVGPQRLTDTVHSMGHSITIYPSHYFIPNHFAGQRYAGSGQVFADQLWGSALKSYDILYKKNI